MLILDTQILIWLRVGNPGLGRQTRRIIRQEWNNGQAAVSAITFWEVAMLSDKGRIDLGMEIGVWRRRLLAAGLTEIRVDGAIGVLAGSLDYPRGDPADRLIIATALDGGHQLVTADRVILDWPGPLNRLRADD